jgi:flagellar biosynthesis protein FlhF
VEITAAVDFDAASLQNAVNAPAENLTAAPFAAPQATETTQTRREPTLSIIPPAKRATATETLAEPAAHGRGAAIPHRALAARGEPMPGAPGRTASSGDAMGTELKTLRRMLETQLAQLAWNDLTRRAPIHVEILRELTEIGITQDLADFILKQLPKQVELGFARRFAISGLSQYLLVTGDRWLENGGRVAFIGATGVGKTTTLAKLAVRWVLRHGPRDLALVGSDTVRIGAQDQIQSLGQLLGVPVYTPENFESLPTLLARLGCRHRLILIDTPGSSLRDAQLANRLGVLSNCASQMETALVLAGSTQAGAIEETVKRFAPANPACCVLTKLDEAASLGGALSALIRARLPVSYVSEGQRVPEDLSPARALELVSTAVRLAKASGAAADEDLLRRRFGKTAHANT